MSKAVLEHLNDDRRRTGRRLTPAGLAADPPPAVRCLLDSDGAPATLRDLVAAVLHAGLLAQRSPWPAEPAQPGSAARAAWREVDHYMEARADDLAERSARGRILR